MYIYVYILFSIHMIWRIHQHIFKLYSLSTSNDIFKSSKQSSKPKLVGLFSLKYGKEHTRTFASSVGKVAETTGSQ